MELKPKLKPKVAKYVVATVIYTILIAIFSISMAGIASYRNDLSAENYVNTGRIFNGPIEQSAPSLNALDTKSKLFIDNKLTPELAKKFIENTYLVSTDASVVMDADFVKKGLNLQPSFKTQFEAIFVLENKADEKGLVSFVFPLPVNGATNELSGATMIVNGKQIENAKTKVEVRDQYGYVDNLDGLKWEGEVKANSKVEVKVSYSTVGLSLFKYQGVENPVGAQDFKFKLRINGTRSYDVVQGLSVDTREFGANFVELGWNKSDLFSEPLVEVSVGERLNPSTQVSRVYLTMSPIYAIFISILLYLSLKFGKKLSIFDLSLVTVLFVVFFPLVHYLSSFTIDPTIELFSTIPNVGEFSMPLYGAFAIAWVLIGGIIFYLMSKLSGFRFASKFVVPTLILFLGFFPLVVTIPEYSMLLVILGFIALLAIVVQVRINLSKN